MRVQALLVYPEFRSRRTLSVNRGGAGQNMASHAACPKPMRVSARSFPIRLSQLWAKRTRRTALTCSPEPRQIIKSQI